ncbi:Na+/H+ antiporter subunit E [Paenirhodobacter sp.]|uniref:Na+/H+ antiporter subunit E n=1 Tax=Paenirhodobacter sp. TaxID=1965326 RepID=UPI003B40D6F2
MKRLVPHPLVSLALLLMWLLLTRFSIGHLLLGGVVALAAGRAMATVQPAGPRLNKWWRIIPLFFIVGYDIAVSNVNVGRRILFGLRGPERGSGFLRIPLRLREPAPLAILALIVTATPGSVWVDFDPETGELLLHVLDVGEADWPVLIRDRYEQPLLEIFG